MMAGMLAHYDFKGSGADAKQIAPFVDRYVINTCAELDVGDVYSLEEYNQASPRRARSTRRALRIRLFTIPGLRDSF